MTKIKQPTIGRFAPVGMNSKRLAGLQSRAMQRLKGRFGGAAPGKRLEGEERAAVVERLRQEGQIL